MKFRAILCALMLTASGLSVGAGERFTMKASSEVSFATAHLTVRTTVEPDPDNRALEIVIDSPDFYPSSLIQLEDGGAPSTSIIEFRSVPGGRFELCPV